ncbi:hypothetical protein B0H13DRAFT_1907294 [Mycena leptocephala]|nr:hypothetical protein B0H13DRAFT_1907294 [Mycena leptocephala]
MLPDQMLRTLHFKKSESDAAEVKAAEHIQDIAEEILRKGWLAVIVVSSRGYFPQACDETGCELNRLVHIQDTMAVIDIDQGPRLPSKCVFKSNSKSDAGGGHEAQSPSESNGALRNPFSVGIEGDDGGWRGTREVEQPLLQLLGRRHIVGAESGDVNSPSRRFLLWIH